MQAEQWRHDIVRVTLEVAVPEGTYLPDKFRLTDAERVEAMTTLGAEDAWAAEREWAMFNVAKHAFDALGIVVTIGTAESKGMEFRPINTNPTEKGE